MSFETALAVILKEEGGFCFTTGDRGGPTNRGITHRAWRKYKKLPPYPYARYLWEWEPDLIIAMTPAARDALGPAPQGESLEEMRDAEHAECAMMIAISDAETAEFYQGEYWAPILGDKLPPVLAVGVFDEAVNAGVGEAVKLLQRLVGAGDDGKMGAGTLTQVANYPTASDGSHTQDQALAAAYAQRRIDVYHQIADAEPADRRFLPGWDARARRVGGLT